MGCGASPQQRAHDSVARAKVAEETRLAPLLVRLEEVTNLYRRGLMSANEYEAYRHALNAEIAGLSSMPSASSLPVPKPVQASSSSQKDARLQRAQEFRRQVDELARQMKNAPDRLPEEYFRLAASLPHKFTHDVQEHDEWRNAGSGPMQDYYNNFAGSTIDDILANGSTTLDAHQNPVGTQFDLPRDGSMQEHTLLLCWFSEEGSYGRPVDALKAKGFEVKVHNWRSSTVQQMMVALLTADVVWLVSGSMITDAAFGQLLDALEAFHHRGGGIFVWGDNAPYFAHANQLLSRLFPGEGIQLEGNDKGGQIMYAHADGKTPGHLTRHHLIMTGLRALFEGVTISYLPKIGPLKVVATYSNGPGYMGKPYCAVADGEVYRRCKVPGKGCRGRVVIDGGFTKLYDEYWAQTAGTERYVKNASTWLLNMNSRIASEDDAYLRSPGQARPAKRTYRVGG
eukprot:TRINITY_DN15828_c0_g2_i1.p1 TRINITY_DN15828_c0_g2~~TRINITY_DN15828_c0_g2_i1.p1  ORF type:complete len:479 (-),score=66.82 TRINITY_DN15828_c0_g2_i1:254-1618(-)